MSLPKDNPSAFPRPFSTTGTAYDFVQSVEEQDGMSLRDWFAGQALAAVITSAAAATGPKTLSVRAYMIADAMLAERAKEAANG